MRHSQLIVNEGSSHLENKMDNNTEELSGDDNKGSTNREEGEDTDHWQFLLQVPGIHALIKNVSPE